MKHYPKFNGTLKLALHLTAALPASLSAQTTLSQAVDMNTFVNSGSPGMNYGSLGAMEIAGPTTSQNRTEESLIQFNTATIQSEFNTEYGVGNWTISSVTLTQYANYPTAGQKPSNSSFNTIAAGGFELDWLSDNNWSQTAITYNNISSVLAGTGGNLQDDIGDFTYAADGTSPVSWTLALDPNLVSDIENGGAVTIFGQPTSGSTVGYEFNTAGQGNPAILNVTAEVVPEPTSMVLMVSSVLGWMAIHRRKNCS